MRQASTTDDGVMLLIAGRRIRNFIARGANNRSRKSKRRPIMKLTFTNAAVAAALPLVGLSAHASCADPRTLAQQGLSHQTAQVFLQRPVAGDHSDKERVDDRIVGTWQVTYTGALNGVGFIQWHSDGTEWEK